LLNPLIILVIGVAVVISMIVVLRINAFLALITAAMVVSLLAPGQLSEKISRVAVEFGATAGKIGIVIALAAVIGRCLIDSGAADRIVRMFLRLLGEKRCAVSLMSSGFVLSIPVFFDTVFYLLLPLARSMHRRTGKSYLLLILAMGAGASITHSLVPPTPGPLLIAAELGIDLGIMISIGLLVAIPTAVVILFFVGRLARRMDIPMRPLAGGVPEPEPLADDKLPGLLWSLMPILLPVLLISANTVAKTIADRPDAGAAAKQALEITSIIGNANLAMLLAAAVAIVVLWRQRRPGKDELAKIIESSLMSGGVIILITSAGGAFGKMLEAAQIGPAITKIVVGETAGQIGGMSMLFIAFFVAFLIKFAQGSSTVSMIATSGMLAPLIVSKEVLGYHPVYIATAIGFGAQCGNWMNDSGFWIFAKMSGLTEVETIKTWTVTVSTLAVIGFLFSLLFANILPLV
jgi:GntP family gluconate:H+ symporter